MKVKRKDQDTLQHSRSGRSLYIQITVRIQNYITCRASGEMTRSMDKAVLYTFLVCCMKEYGLLEGLLVSTRLL